MSVPLEWSDDARRGERPEIRAAIEQVRQTLSLNVVTCSRCRRQTATHLIGVRSNKPRAVCGGCASEWSALTPNARASAATDWARR
jgi:transposase-like protein